MPKCGAVGLLEGTGFEPSVPLLRKAPQSETAARKAEPLTGSGPRTAMLAWSGPPPIRNFPPAWREI